CGSPLPQQPPYHDPPGAAPRQKGDIAINPTALFDRGIGRRQHGDARIMAKISAGNFFEDFSVGQVIRHATPRTVTTGDQALYTALYGSRFAVQSSDAFARSIGYAQAP